MPTSLIFVVTALLFFLFPTYNVMVFAPFLVTIYYFKAFSSCLWWSFAAGFVVDLLSSHTPLGLHAAVFCLATAYLYDKKQFFFVDNLSTFPLMTTFFSFLATLLLALMSGIPLSLDWVISDLVLMPLADALFAFVCYTLPFSWFRPKRRAGHEYFL